MVHPVEARLTGLSRVLLFVVCASILLLFAVAITLPNGAALLAGTSSWSTLRHTGSGRTGWGLPFPTNCSTASLAQNAQLQMAAAAPAALQAQPPPKHVCVLVVNQVQLDRGLRTAEQVRNPGQYRGDLVLVGGDDWRLANVTQEQRDAINRLNITTHHFPSLNTSRLDAEHKAHPFESVDRAFLKKFQWHKFYVFSTWFRQWDVVLYIDAGCNVGMPLEPFFQLKWQGSLLAHSDAYPEYKWKLHIQFDMNARPNITKRLEDFCPHLRERDYFQTTVMLFDTAACINDTTVAELWDLAHTFPIANTNDQSIINLLFQCKLRLWRALDTTYVDDLNRRFALYDYIWRNKNLQYVIWKSG